MIHSRHPSTATILSWSENSATDVHTFLYGRIPPTYGSSWGGGGGGGLHTPSRHSFNARNGVHCYDVLRSAPGALLVRASGTTLLDAANHEETTDLPRAQSGRIVIVNVAFVPRSSRHRLAPPPPRRRGLIAHQPAAPLRLELAPPRFSRLPGTAYVGFERVSDAILDTCHGIFRVIPPGRMGSVKSHQGQRRQQGIA